MCLRLLAAWQFEAGDSGLPACCTRSLASGRIVFVDVPERAVIGGIDRHVRVVAPARVRRALDARAVDDGALPQGHLAQGIATEPSGIADTWKDICSIDYAIAQRYVAFLIHGDAAHPAMDSVIRCKRTLLKDGVGAASPPDLVPARASDAGPRLYRLVGHQRFVRAKVAVGEAEGRPLAVGQDVEEVIGCWRHAGLGRQSRLVWPGFPPQGKIESKLATGSCVLRVSDATGFASHFTSSSQILRASKVAP